jgi:hypothetical protein
MLCGHGAVVGTVSKRQRLKAIVSDFGGSFGFAESQFQLNSHASGILDLPVEPGR